MKGSISESGARPPDKYFDKIANHALSNHDQEVSLDKVSSVPTGEKNGENQEMDRIPRHILDDTQGILREAMWVHPRPIIDDSVKWDCENSQP